LDCGRLRELFSSLDKTTAATLSCTWDMLRPADGREAANLGLLYDKPSRPWM
jgi:hypothetical protein